MTTLNNTDNPCPHGPDHHEPPRLDTIPLDGEETIFAEKWREASAWIQINTSALVEVDTQ